MPKLCTKLPEANDTRPRTTTGRVSSRIHDRTTACPEWDTSCVAKVALQACSPLPIMVGSPPSPRSVASRLSTSNCCSFVSSTASTVAPQLRMRLPRKSSCSVRSARPPPSPFENDTVTHRIPTKLEVFEGCWQRQCDRPRISQLVETQAQSLQPCRLESFERGRQWAPFHAPLVLVKTKGSQARTRRTDATSSRFAPMNVEALASPERAPHSSRARPRPPFVVAHLPPGWDALKRREGRACDSASCFACSSVLGPARE